MKTAGRWDLKPREQAGEFGAGGEPCRVATGYKPIASASPLNDHVKSALMVSPPEIDTVGGRPAREDNGSPAPLIDFLAPLKDIRI